MEVKEAIEFCELHRWIKPRSATRLEGFKNVEVLLQQGEKYRLMWEELKRIHGDGSITTYYVDVGKGETKKELYATRLRTFMNEWEKYFSKSIKKTITREVIK